MNLKPAILASLLEAPLRAPARDSSLTIDAATKATAEAAT